LQGILITHEHGDHVRGVRVFARRHALPVYATEGTWKGMGAAVLEELGPLCNNLSHRTELVIPECAMTALPIRTEHDTNWPVGYVFTSGCGGYRAGVATDMGHEGLMPRELAGCHLLVLEFNHDVGMLKRNPTYPKSLKDRILGDGGHLSNEQAARLLRKMFHIAGEPRLQALVLAHLSEHNNTPELALREARAILGSFRLDGKVEVKVAGPDEPVTVEIRR
jgi:phosphoribosyl 1,2-cyclic phosphodiesterase